jgi:hypothetical protein
MNGQAAFALRMFRGASRNANIPSMNTYQRLQGSQVTPKSPNEQLPDYN